MEYSDIYKYAISPDFSDKEYKKYCNVLCDICK
jgi:hypothetical protein